MPNDAPKVGDTVTLQGTIRGVDGDFLNVELSNPNDPNAVLKVSVRKSFLQPPRTPEQQ